MRTVSHKLGLAWLRTQYARAVTNQPPWQEGEGRLLLAMQTAGPSDVLGKRTTLHRRRLEQEQKMKKMERCQAWQGSRFPGQLAANISPNPA